MLFFRHPVILLVVYLTTLWVFQTTQSRMKKIVRELQIGKDVKGSGRGLINVLS
jgi:Na+/melibiose symporter-like transporter